MERRFRVWKGAHYTSRPPCGNAFFSSILRTNNDRSDNMTVTIQSEHHGGFSVVIENPADNFPHHQTSMNTTSQPRAAAHAFTLVELLTVIAIIAILMGLLFPAIGIIKEQARKAQAKSDVTNIVAA